MENTIIIPDYLSAEQFDLMFEDELDEYYHYEKYKKQLEWEEYYINKQINKNQNEKETN